MGVRNKYHLTAETDVSAVSNFSSAPIGVILRLFSKKIIENYDKNVKGNSSMCKGKK